VSLFQCCLLQCVLCFSLCHTLPSVGIVSLGPLLLFKFCPKYAITSRCSLRFQCHYIHQWIVQFLPVCQYFTLYRLLVLCHSTHCYLLESFHCLSLPHNLISFVSVPL
jgi:hypothetical protein